MWYECTPLRCQGDAVVIPRMVRPRRRREILQSPCDVCSSLSPAHWSSLQGGTLMARMIPDQTFYPSPRMAMSAPPETLAYVAMLNPDGGSDALAVLDVDASSKA